MGMDVSAHPVDVGLIQSRLLPYIRGEGDLSDVLAEVVRVARIRFRANAWGLAVTDLQHKEWAAKRKRPKNATGVAVGKAKAKPRPQPLLPPWFDYNFHVWGRPFLITTPPESVSDTIDRYMAAKTPKQIDAIAAEQLHQLNPALVGKVKLAKGGTLPPTKRLAQGLVGVLDFFRTAYPHLKAGTPVPLPNGETADAAGLFLNDLPLHVVSFASNLRPGWMGRGYVSCTEFIGRAKLKPGKLVESSASLFEPLLGGVKGFKTAFHPTITSNFTLGGYVRPENVPSFRGWLEKNTEKMIAACLKEKWPEADARRDFGKVMEAVRDADHRRLGFIEGCEVYSGPMGMMN